MSERGDDFKRRVIESADIATASDGYHYLWTDGGSYSAHSLRILADELDARNKEWDEQVKRLTALQKLTDLSQELDMGY